MSDHFGLSAWLCPAEEVSTWGELSAIKRVGRLCEALLDEAAGSFLGQNRRVRNQLPILSAGFGENGSSLIHWRINHDLFQVNLTSWKSSQLNLH